MIHASESCAMLTPLALAIFSTLFFFFFYISYIMVNDFCAESTLRVDDCFRSCIITVAFDVSEGKGEKIFREKMCVTQELLVCPHTHHSETGA